MPGTPPALRDKREAKLPAPSRPCSRSGDLEGIPFLELGRVCAARRVPGSRNSSAGKAACLRACPVGRRAGLLLLPSSRAGPRCCGSAGFASPRLFIILLLRVGCAAVGLSGFITLGCLCLMRGSRSSVFSVFTFHFQLLVDVTLLHNIYTKYPAI